MYKRIFKFDLSSGYHHINLHPSIFKYFGFSWSGKFYVFTLFLYLDDGFCFADNYSNCLQASNFVKDTLVKAGFVVNEEKSL